MSKEFQQFKEFAGHSELKTVDCSGKQSEKSVVEDI